MKGESAMFPARLYMGLLGVLLIGYAFFDKGFAYIGYAPIYVGEFALAVGILVIVSGGISSAVFRSPIAWGILIFALWGASATFPYLGTYGILALRDGAVWGYSAFAILSAGILLRTRLIERTLDWYGRWLPWFVIWAPIGFIVYRMVGSAIPLLPGSGVPFLLLKGGDLAVHLAGAIAFLSLGLHRHFPRRAPGTTRFIEWFSWLCLSLAFLIIGALVRGAMSAMMTAILVTLMFKVRARITKFMVSIIFVTLILLLLDAPISLSTGRDIGPGQIISNIETIIRVDRSDYTIDWRLSWWKKIVDYTLFGEHFWTGKGYGINLADDDGFSTGSWTTNPLRSPHNGHLTILARSGVPGIVSWIVLQVIISITLLQGYFRGRRHRSYLLSDVYIWLFAYWSAAVVNMTFDVYLEGPQGGIWFWCLIGFMIALRESQRASSMDNLKQIISQ